MRYAPFDGARQIGTICQIDTRHAFSSFPQAAKQEGKLLHGGEVGGGEVGEFVFIEGDSHSVFGRITAVKLPDRERTTADPLDQRPPSHNPIGTIQLLASVDLLAQKVIAGISIFPRLGAKVFSAHPENVKWIAEQASGSAENGIRLHLARLQDAANVDIILDPEHVFGRHCAVVGSTGSGKSWTVARLIEQAAAFDSKIILLDPTGEFHTLSSEAILHCHIVSGSSDETPTVNFPYTRLRESDLFALFKPSGQVQAPKLRAAIKTLKLLKQEPALGEDGILVKARRSQAGYTEAMRRHAAKIDNPTADFDISKLANQIEQECVFPSDQNNPGYWGGAANNDYSYCIPLISRIEQTLSSKDFSFFFHQNSSPSLLDLFKELMDTPGKRVLRVCLKHVTFENSAREILANAIGRTLLSAARGSRFTNKPILVVVDEAHQFLHKTTGDESMKYELDSFDLIAKEGRKYCLNLCLATQRLRDLPVGVLSQMGTLIVHRLISEQDLQVVENASGHMDASAIALLPTLAPGEAIIVGVDFPIPLIVQMERPLWRPDSSGPNYQRHWGEPCTA